MSMIQNIIQSYQYIYQVEKNYPLEFIVTETLYAERLKCCNSESEKAAVSASEAELQNKHQLLVLPDDHDEHFYLLLHEDLFYETGRYAQAIAYEYTRVIDYSECQEKYDRITTINLRAKRFPDPDFFEFLAEVRASYRGYNLFYNLTSVEKKAAIFSYLCQMVPDCEETLSHDLADHMPALAAFYGRCLAIGAYVNFELSLPDYLNRQPVHDLLALLRDNIDNASIFENYDAIAEAYSDFVLNKSKEPLDPGAAHVHSHQCNHAHHAH